MTEEAKKYAKSCIIKLVKEHKEKCDGECDINTYIILNLLLELGVELTIEERMIFI